MVTKYDEAAGTLQAALKSGYIYPEVYNNLTLSLYSAGKNQEAVSIAREGLKHFPANAAIYNELGIALYQLGRKEESTSALKTAYVMTPETDSVHIVQRLVNLAYPLADTGRLDEALSSLKSAKDISSGDPHIYLALAYCYNVEKNDIKAVEAYEKLGYLGSYPDSEDLVKWAQALDRLKRPKEASRILYIALEGAVEKGMKKQVMDSIKALSAKLKDRQLLNRIDEIEVSVHQHLIFDHLNLLE